MASYVWLSCHVSKSCCFFVLPQVTLDNTTIGCTILFFDLKSIHSTPHDVYGNVIIESEDDWNVNLYFRFFFTFGYCCYFISVRFVDTFNCSLRINRRQQWDTRWGEIQCATNNSIRDFYAMHNRHWSLIVFTRRVEQHTHTHTQTIMVEN